MIGLCWTSGAVPPSHWRSFYEEALKRSHVNASNIITVLPDPWVRLEPFCRGLVHALTVALNATFGTRVQLIEPGSLPQDLAVMMGARVFLSSVSSFGMWAGFGCRGTAYMPVHRIMVGGQQPAVANVQWIDTPTTMCSPHVVKENSVPEAIARWFVRDRGLRLVVNHSIHDRIHHLYKRGAPLDVP